MTLLLPGEHWKGFQIDCLNETLLLPGEHWKGFQMDCLNETLV